VHGSAIQRAQAEDRPLSPDVAGAIEALRAGYEAQLDAKHAAARGFVDAIVTAEETRDQLAFLLQVCSRWDGPHLGPFVLPPDGSAG
jgi:acetyl-CoA carboxylase carboxyltransferase component